MSNDADLHSLDVLLIHDETLFGSTRYNTIGLIDQVTNINNQINMINNAPAPDVYTRPEANEIFNTKADKSDTYTKTETDTLLDDKADKTDTYTKTETDTILDDKADKSELIDSYSKIEDDALLLLKANVADIVDSYSKIEDDVLLDAKADKTDTYTKTETDALLDAKANFVDIVESYSKIEEDALQLLKADKSDTYTKIETDTLLDAKADKTELIDSYSKIEDDALLLLKANVTDLTNYVDLTSAQTITGQKQFGIISVSKISKLSKNDASILLAGGEDMLVSSLITQPQLQEVRDIGTGKSKAYVFSTQDEKNDWMADQENVAKLVIGDNLYIIDKEITDYWLDGTDLKVLETELPDMSNVITTLGTATGGSNAINDISIHGNVLTPAKNKNFVDTDYDQSISGQKIFNTTIHSVGIMVQTYDNSSVVCAGGGVRSIADIQSASYSKSEDDALLLLKADKSTTYTKTEDDALLLLKADKTQLIDSYTKGEINNLLNNKADTGASYSKGEDDAILLLKADKTQLIDSYTNGETNNLLDNKANQSTTYAKTETDQLISDIDVDLTDYYNKTKTDELLGEKADVTELSNYVTLGTSQTINANKTFNNACRFISTINEMPTITGSSFVKSGADNTVVLLGAGGTKPISEFTTTINDSNYVKKDSDVYDIQGILRKITLDQLYSEPTDDDYITLGAVKSEFVSSIYSGSINGNLTAIQFIKSDGTDQQVLLANGTTKPLSEFASGSVDDTNYVKKTGQELQIIHGILRRDDEELSMSAIDEDYLIRGEIYNAFVSRYDNQMIYGTKTFNSNVSAAGFAKTCKDDTSVLLAGGCDQLLSSFGGAQVEDITNLILNLHSNITFNYLKLTRIGTFYTLMMEIIPKTQIGISTGTIICSTGTVSTGIFPPTPPSTSYPIQLATKRKTLTCVHLYRDIRITTDSTEAWGVNDDVGLQFSWML
ncbi:MAG: hypothetical protein EZS28_019638 [Streblomastix strix]|uniref:Uncharacterized protein n=1 Tax=Streblomastix strix TaxID=222440 RepID=A0A5J4VQH8_9EUKA|nr:MAG: hypothetical protein EZS28_019638 [Streblomastix strix]